MTERERFQEILGHIYNVLKGPVPNVPAALSIVGQAYQELKEQKEAAHDSKQ